MASQVAHARSIDLIERDGVLVWSIASGWSAGQILVGIRMAMGARVSDVLGLVLGRGMRLAVVGVGVGAIASIALGRVLSSLLYGVSAIDPVAFGGAATLLLAVAFVANLVPARRASRVPPTVALRYE